jgi:hypothetical protein
MGELGMKNKYLIILFIFFLGAIFLSLLIVQQSQKAVSEAEKEITITGQVESRVLPAYSTRVSQTSAVSLPLAKSGITIIRVPAIELKEKSISVPKIADKATNIIASQNVASSSEASSEAQDIPQAGITKIGKRPTPKEAQEMNSSGIVMY